MKHLKFTALAIILTALPACSFAQKNLQKAIDRFVSNTASNGIYKYTEDKASDRAADYYYEWGFRLSKTDLRKIESIRNAFYQDASCAYGLHTKDAGVRGEEQLIGYGNRLEKKVSFCTHKDRNYIMMYVRDAKDSLRRDVYALVWWKDGGKIEGTIHHISSYDPQRASWNGTKIVPRDRMSNVTNSTGDVRSYRSVSTTNYPDGSTLINYGNGNSLLVYPDGTTLSRSSAGTEQTFSSSTTNGKNQTIIKGSKDSVPFDSEKLTSGDDVLSTFGNLRTAYLKAVREQGDDAVKTGLAQYVLRLCKENGSKLSADEKKLCISSIKEMKEKTSTDEYIRGLFDLSMKALQK